MKRKTRRLIFFFATIGFLVVACLVVGLLVPGRSGGGDRTGASTSRPEAVG